MSNIVVVLGSWGSGTTAAVGALELMGCNTCPPHFMTWDPRTPNSFEPLSLREIIIPILMNQSFISAGLTGVQ